MSAYHPRDLQCKRASRSMHSQVDYFLVHFGVLASQRKIAFKTIFLLIFDSFSILRILKNIAPADDFEDRCICFMIALETDLGPILVRFWTPKSFQNRSQEGPEGCWKSWSFLHAFGNLQKSIFGPTWPQLGPQDGPKLEPKWDRNRTKKGLGSEVGSRADFGSIFDRFLVDFWDDFWQILGWFLVEFW